MTQIPNISDRLADKAKTATPALRLLTIPANLIISKGVGLITPQGDGGELPFSIFFKKSMLDTLAGFNDEEAEDFLVSRLCNCVAGEIYEIPDRIWQVLCKCLPTKFATTNPELYIELRPYIRAIRNAELKTHNKS